MTDRQWDPFAGLGLGYLVANVFGSGVNLTNTSGLYIIGRGGIRYFLDPKTSPSLDVGTGAASVNVGVMWRL